MNNENALPLNAMIVEDEQDLCVLLSIVLKQKNLNPACAYSLAEAKRKINHVNPSVLFLDNNLPDGYGIDFISEVKSKSPYTKIVMMTAHNSSTDQNRAIQNGADYFISKPFTSGIIKNTIDQLLS
jgi:two-component system, OmpR family, response regulator